jgi:hypothetical protein
MALLAEAVWKLPLLAYRQWLASERSEP